MQITRRCVNFKEGEKQEYPEKIPRSTRNSTHMYHSPTSSTHQTWFFSIRRGTMHEPIAYRNNIQVCLITSVHI